MRHIYRRCCGEPFDAADDDAEERASRVRHAVIFRFIQIFTTPTATIAQARAFRAQQAAGFSISSAERVSPPVEERAFADLIAWLNTESTHLLLRAAADDASFLYNTTLDMKCARARAQLYTMPVFRMPLRATPFRPRRERNTAAIKDALRARHDTIKSAWSSIYKGTIRLTVIEDSYLSVRYCRLHRAVDFARCAPEMRR